MKNFILNSIVAGLVFGIMDSLWFAVFMKKFAQQELQPLLRMSQGKMSAHMPSVFMAYLLMIIVSSVFLAPKISPQFSTLANFSMGAIMGLCVFGIFDFTNSALFSPYPIKFVVADVLWGTFMYGCLAVVLTRITPLFYA